MEPAIRRNLKNLLVVGLLISFLIPTTTLALDEQIPTRDEEDVFWLINYFARQNGVDVELGLDLAEFESGFDKLAKNPNSSAKGVFQFIDGTWKALCKGNVFNTYDNVKCAMELIGKGGLSHWTADLATRAMLVREGHYKEIAFK